MTYPRWEVALFVHILPLTSLKTGAGLTRASTAALSRSKTVFQRGINWNLSPIFPNYSDFAPNFPQNPCSVD